MVKVLTLVPGDLTLSQLRRIARGRDKLAIDEGCRKGVEAAAQTVADVVARGEVVYGINTGLGKLASRRIGRGQLARLQRNLILSHSAGTGPLLDDAVVRLVLVLKAAGLARGHSGVRWDVIEALMGLIEHEVYPCIPLKGSVGASGDLAPLAHLGAALIGVGGVRHKGELIPAKDGLAAAGLTPLELGPKEGLALVNGTQVSTALALSALFTAEDLLASALVTGAMTLDAAKGSDTPFDARVHELRGQPGQTDVAAALRGLVRGSAIRDSHLECSRVQDPYSLRCMPQVMGACLDQIRFAAGTLEREANAVTDNPLIFAAEGEVLSGGNFHGEPVAMAADGLAIALAEIGALAEREFGVRDSLSGMRKLLHGLGLSWLQPRPRHPASDAEAQAEFKKNRRGWSPRSRRPTPKRHRSNFGSRTRCGSARRVR
ncbi:MAG: aromatic amino acid lyase [Proteobacteria bacterium]|nr:aromatic amino acid lyase [Pseudomonadota bacterium]